MRWNRQDTIQKRRKAVEPPAPPGKPVVFSASRRTDLPGFHGRWLAQTLADKQRRMRTRYLHSVVFWSRHPRPFLPGGALHGTLSEVDNPVLHLTITGDGGTAWEPGVPATDQVLEALPALVASFGDPARIVWRYDPLIAGRSTVERFARIAAVCADCGVERCVVSFPASASLKGPLAAQYARHGVPRWSREQQRTALARLAEEAARRRLQLFTCAQSPDLIAGLPVRPAACIDAAWLVALHPHHWPLPTEKDPAQRRWCNCARSEDLGDYQRHRCRGGCVYCYSSAGGPTID